MRLACVVAISGYSPTDLASKRESLKAILRPDTQLDMFAARVGCHTSSRVSNFICQRLPWRKCGDRTTRISCHRRDGFFR